MPETRVSATLLHRDHIDCPVGVQAMMSDVNRTGCSNGNSCPGPRDRGMPARAEFYARHTKQSPEGKRERRAMYFCAHCAKQFAGRHKLAYAVPEATP